MKKTICFIRSQLNIFKRSASTKIPNGPIEHRSGHLLPVCITSECFRVQCAIIMPPNSETPRTKRFREDVKSTLRAEEMPTPAIKEKVTTNTPPAQWIRVVDETKTDIRITILISVDSPIKLPLGLTSEWNSIQWLKVTTAIAVSLQSTLNDGRLSLKYHKWCIHSGDD